MKTGKELVTELKNPKFHLTGIEVKLLEYISELEQKVSGAGAFTEGDISKAADDYVSKNYEPTNEHVSREEMYRRLIDFGIFFANHLKERK